jgi:CHAD domain-containing protein
MARSDRPVPKPPSQETVQSAVEHEIKLSVDARFRLPRLAGTPLPRRLLTSIYFDTPQYDLTHAGITLRRRIERGTSTWQLKLPLVNDRQELAILDRHPLPPKAFRELLLVHIGERRLQPVATLRTWRTGVRVGAGRGSAVEVTLDRVSVLRNGTVTKRFRELEIELVKGADGLLRDVEGKLRQAGAGDHDGRPKLFHALSLPPPGPPLRPPADAPAVEHVTWALARHVRWLLAHDPGVRIGREPESLHQMRVAARQLRAVLRAARPLLVREWADALRSELRWLVRLLGPARDLDVQIQYLRDEAAGMSAPDRRPLLRFVAYLTARREELQRELLRWLTSGRYLELIRRLRQAAHRPTVVESDATLRELAGRECKRLRKAIRRAGSSPTAAWVHEVRIKTKRARYAAELAEPVVGRAASRFIKRAKVVQDVLGMHQDAVQAEAFLGSLLKQARTVREAFVVGRMVERQRARRDRARKRMRKLLRSLLKRGRRAWG